MMHVHGTYNGKEFSYDGSEADFRANFFNDMRGFVEDASNEPRSRVMSWISGILGAALYIGGCVAGVMGWYYIIMAIVTGASALVTTGFMWWIISAVALCLGVLLVGAAAYFGEAA